MDGLVKIFTKTLRTFLLHAWFMESPCSRALVQPPLFVSRSLSTSSAHMRTPRSSEPKYAKWSSKLALDHVLTGKKCFF